MVASERDLSSLDKLHDDDALVSYFRSAANEGQEKASRHSYFSPLRKRLVLGTIIDMKGEAAK
jgi:hypothetical protein